jgi:putative ABC transport system permease protein
MNDLKYALRALTKRPVFALIAIVTLALGIGLNTAMFSLMNSIFLRPLPFADSASLVRIYRTTKETGEGDLSPADYGDLKAAEARFGHFASSSEETVSLTDAGRPAEAQAALRISADYLSVLRVRPEIGRFFRQGEEAPGNPRVALISHALWESRFGAAADIVGRTLRIDGVPHEIIGVLPASANDGRLLRQVGILRPISLTAVERASRAGPWMRVIGRRDPTVSKEQGNAIVAAVGTRLASEHAKDDGGASFRSVSLNGATGNQSGRAVVGMLLGLSGFVLLIACSNLANFVLARMIERSQELSVRSALGASLFQLIRPLALESLLLAVAGGAAALLVALWSTRWLSAQSVANGGSLMEFPLDWRVLSFAVGSSIATALAFGTAPALLIAKLNLNDRLKSGMRGATAGGRHQRLRSLLVIAQFAMAMTLVAGAGFLVRGTRLLIREHFGWDSANVAEGTVDLPKATYNSPEKILAFQRQLTTRLRSIPGVESVALAYALPYSGSIGTRHYLVEGRDRPAQGEEPAASYDGITPDYFKVTGGRLVDGRPFADADTLGSARVVIINQEMAHAFFPNESPLGHRISRADSEKPEWSQIVGIAADVRPTGIYQRPSAFQVYHPLAQEPWQYTTFALRTEPGALTSVLAAVSAAVAGVDPDLPVGKLMTADSMVDQSSFDLGMLKKMLGAFAALGLLLAAIGIYGVVARVVAQRTPEIGIRMALGASMDNIRRMILGSGLRLALAGGCVGFAGALAITRFLRSMMPGVEGGAEVVVAGALAVLALVALLASYLPARAASKIDPVIAIRAE